MQHLFNSTVLFRKIVEVALEPAVLENVKITGKFLLDGIKALQAKHPKIVSGARGTGTFCAFDMDSVDHRNAFVTAMKQKGTV